MKIYRQLIFVLLSLFSEIGCTEVSNTSPFDQQRIDQLIDQGVIQMRNSDLSGAAGSFTVALEIGRSAAALDGLGCLALIEGDYRRAETYFWAAYNESPTYNNSLGNLALLYEISGDRLRAQQLYQRVLTEDPYNYRSRNNFAIFLASKAKNEGRLEELKHAEMELLKAQSLSEHPVITDNLHNLKEIK